MTGPLEPRLHDQHGVAETLRFECDGRELAAVLAQPPGPMASSLGVLIVPGPRQTRSGPHRLFTLLARQLADAGYGVLRFDGRGQGDSEGDSLGLEGAAAEIPHAIDVLQQRCPTVQRVVLFGLSDGATAAMLNSVRDPRITGLALCNPVTRMPGASSRRGRRATDASLALPEDRGGLVQRLRGVLRRAGVASSDPVDNTRLSLSRRLYHGMEAFAGPVLLVLAGNDMVAAQFRQLIAREAVWARLAARPAWTHRELPEATHTFSSAVWRRQVATWTCDWLSRLEV